jgi:hypothetical protein
MPKIKESLHIVFVADKSKIGGLIGEDRIGVERGLVEV